MLTHPRPADDSWHHDYSRIAQDLQIRKVQVENVARLLDEENTIPFIARYRKEMTGGLDEEILRTIQERLRQLRKLAERKQTILKSLELNGKLTPELRAAILAADQSKRLEDLYLPFKRKEKQTRADKARERGLGMLAEAVWYADSAADNLDELLAALIDPAKELSTPDEVRAGVQDILAERIAESADVRDILRRVMWDTGRITSSKHDKLAEGQGQDYKDYFQFAEALKHIPPHRVLALNRGEKANALSVRIEWDADLGLRVALDRLPLPPAGTPMPLPEPVAPPTAAVEPAVESGSQPVLETAHSDASQQETPTGGESSGESAPAESAKSESIATPDDAISPVNSTPESGSSTSDPSSDAPPTDAVESTATIPGSSEPAAEEPHSASPESESRPSTQEHNPAQRSGQSPRRHRHEIPRPNYRPLSTHPHAAFLEQATRDALQRLLTPSLEREIRRDLAKRAEEHAVEVFARNLRSKLLAPPLRGRRVLAIDPAFRTGCKCVVLDDVGTVLDHAVVHPHPSNNKKGEEKLQGEGAPRNRKRIEADVRIEELIRKHQTSVIAIGNGTACRETEEWISELIAALSGRTSEPTAASIDSVEPPTASGEVTTDVPSASTETVPESAPSVAEVPESSSTEIAPAEEPATPPTEPTAQAAEATTGEPATPPTEPTAQNTETSGEPAAPAADTAPPATPEKPAPPPRPLPVVDPTLPPPPADLAYVIVNEAGASVYSASPTGREEFPDLDVTLRGTISIGRRLQDPLSELVKIDPQHVGVGLYQHDVQPRQLRESLDAVIESCVNAVGVDLNTAGVALLRHVSGLNQLAARELVEFRKANGPFREREQLKQVPSIGERRFTQAAGFLKIVGGANPLDATWVHPESYAVAQQLLTELGCGPEALTDRERMTQLREKLQSLAPDQVAERLRVGIPTVRDILDALARPGRDPRDDLPPPVFKKGILKLEDLAPGMELQGTVLNVVDFGAFVDVGLKDSGLVHISQLANRFVKDPHDVVSVGDTVKVWVMAVDSERHRVSLTMIPPGTERRPAERKGPPRRERAPRPPREPRPALEAAAAGSEITERPPQQPVDRRPPRGAPRGRPGARPQQPAAGGDQRRLPPRGQRRDGTGAPPPAAARSESGGEARPKRTFVITPPSQVAASQAAQPARPRRQGPKPKLSDAALAGKESLTSFGQLAAFWAARQKQAEAAETPADAPPSAPEPGQEPVAASGDATPPPSTE